MKNKPTFKLNCDENLQIWMKRALKVLHSFAAHQETKQFLAKIITDWFEIDETQIGFNCCCGHKKFTHCLISVVVVQKNLTTKTFENVDLTNFNFVANLLGVLICTLFGSALMSCV